MYLREFLKKHKALTKFKKNFQADKQDWFNDIFHYHDGELNNASMSPERYIREHRTNGIAISSGFDWGKTLEHYFFWNSLNAKWQSDFKALNEEEKALIEEGGLLYAVKSVKERTNLGLKEAKEVVDQYRKTH